MLAELRPVYDNRKSFYGKAQIEIKKDKLELYSYSTLVAEIERDGNKCKVFLDGEGGLYSPTTLRHIKDFLYQSGVMFGTKFDIISRYGVKRG